MKTIKYSLSVLAIALLVTACNNVSYNKTASGLLYKIIPGGAKDSLKTGSWLKIYFRQTLEDSVLMDNYGKMPVYAQNISDPNAAYNPVEIFSQLKKGDSAVTVMFVDSLLSKKLMPELPPFMKKGQKITTYFKIVEVFTNDSLYQQDYTKEMERDRPRAMKEQEEQMAKREKEYLDAKIAEEKAAEQSGEAAKQLKDVEAYLSAKNIKAQQTGNGAYVQITEPGTGTAVTAGKYVSIKYTGKSMVTDSTFDSGVIPFQVGKGKVISGLDEGIQVFKQGGKGTVFITGYKAYGKNPGQGSPFKPNEPLLFDVEVLSVSDTMPSQQIPH